MDVSFSSEAEISVYFAGVKPRKIKGSVSVPSSKSILQRYIIGALLAEGETELLNVRHCDDTLACLSAVQTLGAEVSSDVKNFVLSIKGTGPQVKTGTKNINAGESGFALRALAAIAALQKEKLTLTGKGSLLRRPMKFFEDVFPQLDVRCKTNNGLLPMEVTGPAKFRSISVDGSLSSQFLSGLLMIYPFADKDHEIEVVNLKSRQYIDLTMQVLNDFGIEVRNESYQKFLVRGNQQYKPCTAHIEGDWSAASFMLVAGAIAGEVTVNNLSMNSLQPDQAIMEILKQCGAEVITGSESVTVKRSRLKSFSFDATGCPDLFPPLVTLASQCDGISEISGTERLIHKESNRALALQSEFSKLNEKMISMEGNKMMVQGGLKLESAVVDSHHDHRIAMALAVASLQADGDVQIHGKESIMKSYPDFFNDLQKLISHE